MEGQLQVCDETITILRRWRGHRRCCQSEDQWMSCRFQTKFGLKEFLVYFYTLHIHDQIYVTVKMKYKSLLYFSPVCT